MSGIYFLPFDKLDCHLTNVRLVEPAFIGSIFTTQPRTFRDWFIGEITVNIEQLLLSIRSAEPDLTSQIFDIVHGGNK